MSTSLPVSVVVPTIGRIALLRQCLESLAACEPRAAEILVVDQSKASEVGHTVAAFESAGGRLVPCADLGVSPGTNLGVHEAAHEVVCVTHDDCTVDPAWIGTAWKLIDGDADQILTGRVLPVGDPEGVPSTRDDPEPIDYTGLDDYGALWPNDMVLGRSAFLAFGEFDKRCEPAEDLDFCFRWLRAGNRLRYEPELVVWHHDWRSHDELVELYVRYWRGQGKFYGKHIRRGELVFLRLAARDLLYGARAMGARLLRGRPRWSDRRRGVVRGLLPGLVEGLVTFNHDVAGNQTQSRR
jgi:GT2 family glycosyltransferase